MSRIPTRDELARNKSDADAAAARQREESDFNYYKEKIITAMEAGNSSYPERTGNVSPTVQARLQSEFRASGWTLSFSNARTGCTISWS